MHQSYREVPVHLTKVEFSTWIFQFPNGNYCLQQCLSNTKKTLKFFICFLFIISYPFEPPLIKFITKVYHPNIDNTSGAICMDLLKMPPKGNWRPAINLSSLLTSVQLLLGDPNPNDPLDADIVKYFHLLYILIFIRFMIAV